MPDSYDDSHKLYMVAFYGAMIGVCLCVIVMLFMGVPGNHKLVKNHKGLDKVLQEWKEDCERQADVVKCEWKNSQYTPVSN